MEGIPTRCPQCGNENGWKEVVNPFTTGIPIFGGLVRISLIQTRGFRFRRVTWRCESCGFEAKYRLP